jgi:hypothetical protein
MVKQKRGQISNIKTYFIIVNLIISIIAFSWMVSATCEQQKAAYDSCLARGPCNAEATALINCKDLAEKAEKNASAQPAAPAAPPSPAPKPAETGGNTVQTLLGLPATLAGAMTLRDSISGKKTVVAGKQVVSGVTDAGNDYLNGLTNLDYRSKAVAEASGLSPERNEEATLKYLTENSRNFKTGTTATVPEFTLKNFLGYAGKSLLYAGMVAGIAYIVFDYLGPKGSNAATAAAIGAGAGVIAYMFLSSPWAQDAFKYNAFGNYITTGWTPALIGVGVAVALFWAIYKNEKRDSATFEFSCLPWQAPIGGKDCEKCNDMNSCNEYVCKSLGQACEIINPGTAEEKCIWKNPKDVNSPIVSMVNVSDGHLMRVSSAGVEIIGPKAGGCIQAFTPLTFTITTKDNKTFINETSQCKIDYNLNKTFDQMGYFVGKDSIFKYNHTETLSLPGPDAINKVSPEIKNNGNYTLFILCQDANGNKNGKPFLVKFCVEKGPDSTPPNITGASIPSNSPIVFNKSSMNLEIYVNEPSECRWSRQNIGYDNMENNMSCVTDVLKMNPLNTYTCKTNLTGIISRQNNDYYFRCKDQPGSNNSERNANIQGYHYVIIGTQPLYIMNLLPENGVKIMGATDYINITLTAKTDGYKNGESICYYSLTENDYIEFLETNSNVHTQRQDLPTGNYTYHIKCVDLGGNAAYNSTSFNVETDVSPPTIVRAYKYDNNLKIITNEKAECGYSNLNCNFDFNDSVKMNILNIDYTEHSTDWSTENNYYIKCRDKYNNQPDINTCSIILRPIDLISDTNPVEEM